MNSVIIVISAFVAIMILAGILAVGWLAFAISDMLWADRTGNRQMSDFY